jgi:uncharacterized protein
MRSLLLVFALTISCFAIAQQKQQPNSFVRPLPKPAKAVNDYSKFLTASETQYLEKELARYHAASSNAIVIITLDSLTDKKTKQEYTVEDAALLYFNTWGIGDRIKNNGVLLMATRKPRKLRIAVGSGLEDILTDNVCQQIVDEKLVPNFKQGLFFTGFKEAIAALEDKLDHPVAVASSNNDIYATHASTDAGQIVQADTGMSPGFMAIIALSLVGIIIVVVIFFQRNYGEAYSSSGYNMDHGTPQHVGIIASTIDHNSSSSFSSPSPAPDSFSGGSSNGGGANGNW